MPSSFSFTAGPFSVASAFAIDANTVRVTMTAVPDAFVPGNFSIPTTTVVAVVTDPQDPNSVLLALSPGLQPNGYTVSCVGLTSNAAPMVAPFTAAFQVFVGPAVQFTPNLANPGVNPTALSTLRALVPPSMKGDVWTQLLETLGEEEQQAWDQAAAVYDQLFLVSANGKYLDQRASEEGGYDRPELVGFGDDAFRDLVIQLSTRKLTLNAFLRVLEIYFGIDAVRAHTTTTAAQNFSIPDGSEQAFMVDGRGPFTVTFRAADFTNQLQVSAIEAAVALNRRFRDQHISALALPKVDSQTGLVYLSVYTNARGLRGSIESVSGPIPFAAGRHTVQDQVRAAYAKTLPDGSVEVVLPATSIVVARTPNQDAAYLDVDYTEVGGGPYLHEPDGTVAVTETVTTTTQSIEAGHQYPSITVTSTVGFPDARGYLVFGFGHGYQAGPVLYLGVGGPTTLLLDPSFAFPQAMSSGATVNLAERLTDDQMPHGDQDFWLTPSPAGRVACESNLDEIVAGGRQVTKTVRYPGDVGLGGAGLPTSGVPRLTDAVMVWSSDDTDAEVTAAREA